MWHLGFKMTIFTESCENESSNDHENRLDEVGPDDGRKATGHGEDAGNRLERQNSLLKVLAVTVECLLFLSEQNMPF